MFASTIPQTASGNGGNPGGTVTALVLVPDMTCPAGAYGAATTIALGSRDGVIEVIIG
jgi:hypothetical protein